MTDQVAVTVAVIEIVEEGVVDPDLDQGTGDDAHREVVALTATEIAIVQGIETATGAIEIMIEVGIGTMVTGTAAVTEEEGPLVGPAPLLSCSLSAHFPHPNQYHTSLFNLQ
jgi:hypothetical protein